MASPASRASLTLGRMPTAITTSDAGISRPSFSRIPSTLPCPYISAVSAPVRIVCPRASSASLSSQPAASSSCRSISVGIRWSTVTFMPRSESPCAASSPSRPPPITTASPPCSAARSILPMSSMSRNVTTPCKSWPGHGMMNGSDPVASNSLS